MDFTLSSEQAMLRDGARRFLESAGDKGWARYAELGWLAAAVPEDAGGLGADVADMALLAEEMGRALAPPSFADGAVLAVRLVDRIAGATRRALLSGVMEGARRLAPALYEPRRRYALSPETRADRSGGGYALSGAKVLVADGEATDGLLVSAALDGGIGLFLVDPAGPGVERRAYDAVDGSRFADFAFHGAPLDPAGLLGAASPEILEDALDEARLCVCADMLGGLERAMEMTADYLKTRTQFGQPLAGFQALQHALADMFVEADAVRSSVFRALSAFGGDDRSRRRAVSSCWVETFGAAKQLAGMAVHLHGAIGFTEEYRVGQYLRRAMVAERRFGDVEHHLDRYRTLAG
ncbi:MAG: acyl-CoA dehydrogenase [Alphaproteobacteria bacterium]|nr:acyl-CoA dehydrogenase [Alphaproteobacteria bacterium]